MWSILTGVNLKNLEEDIMIWFRENFEGKVDKDTLITSIDSLISDIMNELRIPPLIKMKDLKELKRQVKCTKKKQISLFEIIPLISTHEDNAEQVWKNKCRCSYFKLFFSFSHG